MVLHTFDGHTHRIASRRYPAHTTCTKDEERTMLETILIWYAGITYVLMAVILFCARHEIEMVHLRNPIRYPMDKVMMVCAALLAFSPITIYWVIYEIWIDKTKGL